MKWKFLLPVCLVSDPLYVGRPAIVAPMRACAHRKYEQSEGTPVQQVDNFPECTITAEKCVKCGVARTKITGPEEALREMYNTEILSPWC